MKLIMGVFTTLVLFSVASLSAAEGGYISPNRPAVSPFGGASVAREAADMKEDIRGLQRQLKELSLRVELLESQKSQLEEQIAKATPDLSGLPTREELTLLEQRTRDYAMAEDKKVREVIMSEIKAVSSQRYNVNEPEARRGSSSSSYQTPQPLMVSDAEKQRYMREGVRHVVRSGDTLSDIARRYRSSVRAIRAVNNITDPNRLFVGMELFVPTSIQ